MQRRHFLVKEEDGDYKLKEIDPAIAQGISLFGTITGQCYSVEAVHWTFYFMNACISNEHADKIATQLTQDFLTGNR
ncbi:MAG: hypothetical protein ACFE0Q_08605 [Anaerolineae bacterium]